MEGNLCNQQRKGCVGVLGTVQTPSILINTTLLVWLPLLTAGHTEYLCLAWDVGAFGHHSWSDDDFRRAARGYVSAFCRILHPQDPCDVDFRFWA